MIIIMIMIIIIAITIIFGSLHRTLTAMTSMS